MKTYGIERRFSHLSVTIFYFLIFNIILNNHDSKYEDSACCCYCCCCCCCVAVVVVVTAAIVVDCSTHTFNLPSFLFHVICQICFSIFMIRRKGMSCYQNISTIMKCCCKLKRQFRIFRVVIKNATHACICVSVCVCACVCMRVCVSVCVCV